MNTILEAMLNEYVAVSLHDRKNALKEIFQELILAGLARAGFFKKAAFYGGTALRIFYGLDRFSEDLDFSLLQKDKDFELSSFFPAVLDEIESYGLSGELSAKAKSGSPRIRSAFFKTNTQKHLILLYGSETSGAVHAGELVKIKIEVDVDPPEGAGTEHRYRLLPSPYETRLYDAPSLFAGKIHAVLCRAWKNRVKGRDLYDYLFLLSRRVPVNFAHLKARMLQTACAGADERLSFAELKQLLYQRFEQINYREAKADVAPFLRRQESLGLWSADFFRQVSEELQEA